MTVGHVPRAHVGLYGSDVRVCEVGRDLRVAMTLVIHLDLGRQHPWLLASALAFQPQP
jgi:hypothetical protein